ncbi:MAG: hypothetical protein E7813_22675 [Bradyrhizobium sp.]|uniref:hypothetical protein n=1 Tax=Bradyrhizobium sp. TaxID=376 RepID=UPI0011F619D3|nr:hypothetical protein [Bradyrhizobium sp.]THD60797.1 MAG: hypothetical protein E7813_22675 [Bradyrhizobium sp.]
MPLHRDIFWVGKQWAVTGYGMQAIDQKLKGKFDIEAARLWDDDLPDALSDEKWFNIKDFDKGLAVARKHYPEPPRKAPPAAAERQDPKKAKDKPKENPAPAPAVLAMHLEGCRAKFLPTWRIRARSPR